MKAKIAFCVLSLTIIFGVVFLTAQNPCGTVTDADGNTYGTVQIGSQCWMKENLRTTHYPNGQAITEYRNIAIDDVAPEFYSYPPNNEFYKKEYGLYYNWQAVMFNVDPDDAGRVVQGICPDGWHVPSDEEWSQLVDFVGNQSKWRCGSNHDYIAKALSSQKIDPSRLHRAARDVKASCCIGSKVSSNDASGFSALPAGYLSDKEYNFLRGAYFWSSTESGESYAKYIGLHTNPYVFRGDLHKDVAVSVRCVRDDENVSSVKSVDSQIVGKDISSSDSAPGQDVKNLVVAKMAQYPGGDQALRQYLMQNVWYLPAVRDAGLQGTVLLGFYIETDGSVNGITIVQGICKPLDDSCIGIVKAMPKWTPARNAYGENVRCYFTLPFQFALY